MAIQHFIFSSKYRVARHLAFWTACSLHFIIQNLMIGGPGEATNSRTFSESALHYLYFFPCYFLSLYIFTGVLLPVFFFKRKYGWFVAASIAVFLLNFTGVYLSGMLYLHNQYHIRYDKIAFDTNKYHAIADGIFFPGTLFAIACGIKMAKQWYLKQQENRFLAKQKSDNELQLLKTRIHPRFLFHSLQSLEKNIKHFSPTSPQLLLKLSDLLSYVLYECDEDFILLEKECEAINNYISLEKDMNGSTQYIVNVEGPTENKMIPPHILLSAVERAFEYAHETHEQRSFSLTISMRVSEEYLHFKADGILQNQINNAVYFTGKFDEIKDQIRSAELENHYFDILSNENSFSILIGMDLKTKEIIDHQLSLAAI
jgi:Histidine kinase